MDITPVENPHATDTLAVNPDGTLKYTADDRGYPTDWYVYDLPLTTDDTTFTYWNINSMFLMAQQIPEGGFETSPYKTFIREKTGVNIQYINADGDIPPMLFSLMLASDDLADICILGTEMWRVVQGPDLTGMVDEGFFANLADYRAYMPNFFYQVPRFDYNPELINMIWYNDELVLTVGPMIEDAMPSTGYLIRGDWLDRLGDAPKATDLKTYDQWKDVLTRFRNEIIPADDPVAAPIAFFMGVELEAGRFFGGMNTALTPTLNPQRRVVDGKVLFTMTEPVDYDALTLWLDWYSADLINKNWQSVVSTMPDMSYELHNDKLGVIINNASEISGFENNGIDPNTRWDAMPYPQLTENFERKYANAQPTFAYGGGGWSISAKSSNVPLLATYTDWFFSEEGAFDASWGIEGVTYTFNEKGEPQLTELVYNNPDGLAVNRFLLAYEQIGLIEPARHYIRCNYAYPGGDRYLNANVLWMQAQYDTALKPYGYYYDWPSTSAALNKQQNDETAMYLGDANTWFQENYFMFLTESRALTPESWQEFVTGLFANGYDRYQAVWQNVYDAYTASRDDNG
jgi:hypothetical protein